VWFDGPGESATNIAVVSRLIEQRLLEIDR
jgi:hypothetical protein